MSLTPELIEDELDLIRRAIPLAGAELLDLGCGDGAMARRLVAAGARVIGAQVDAAAVARAGSEVDVLEARAEALPFREASFDAVLMLKSLHHVPLALMPDALIEVARVLRPGGLLFCWEPVFAGPLNDIMRLFHDEQAERRAALAALHDIVGEKALDFVDERVFRTRISFAGFEDFEQRMLHLPTLAQEVDENLLGAIHAAWDEFGEPRNGRFERLMRLTLLKKPYDQEAAAGQR